MSRPPALLLLALALTPAAAAHAAPCGVDLHTLLTVHTSRRIDFRTLPGRLPPPPVEVAEDVLVTQGGAATDSRVTTTFCCDIPDLRSFASGIAARADLVRLRDALAAVHVGLLRDCVFENDLTTVTGIRVRGDYEVTWYGRGGRRNRFTIVYADAGTTALPLCAPEHQQIIDAVRTFTDALAADPDRRVCPLALAAVGSPIRKRAPARLSCRAEDLSAYTLPKRVAA